MDVKIDNDKLCKILTEQGKKNWNWMSCYFPRENDFSMPYKPRYFSLFFSNGQEKILIDYTAIGSTRPGHDFEPKKAEELIQNLDWAHLVKHSHKQGEKTVFSGALNKTDRFDLIIPEKIENAVITYLDKVSGPAPASTEKPKIV